MQKQRSRTTCIEKGHFLFICNQPCPIAYPLSHLRLIWKLFLCLKKAASAHRFLAEFNPRLPARSHKKRYRLQIGLLCGDGISPEKEGYSVPLIAGKSFSGYQVLAYYYVSWAKAFPEYLEQLQLPFAKEYEFAKEIRGMGEGEMNL